jgi:hypothetical protein
MIIAMMRGRGLCFERLIVDSENVNQHARHELLCSAAEELE